MDPDPHSLGSVDTDPHSESESSGIPCRDKQSVTNTFLGVFVGNYIFFKTETKKVAYLKGLGTDLKLFCLF